MRIVCQQTVLMKYHALFVNLEKAAKFENVVCCKLSLSSTGSILSNTDLSDLSTWGTCDIFVYKMRHRVM